MKTIVALAVAVLGLMLAVLNARAVYKYREDQTPGPEQPGGKLSLRRVVKRDRVARSITWPFISIAALYLAFFLMGLPKLRPFSLVMAGLAVIVVPLFISRILFYQKLFAKGMEVAGKVTGISISDAWTGPTSSDSFTSKNIKCRIAYSYSFRDRVYSGKGVVVGGDDQAHYLDMMDTALLRPGDEVSLLVDPERPEHSILRDLFAEGTTNLKRK